MSNLAQYLNNYYQKQQKAKNSLILNNISITF